jgi:hypothetical protein
MGPNVSSSANAAAAAVPDIEVMRGVRGVGEPEESARRSAFWRRMRERRPYPGTPDSPSATTDSAFGPNFSARHARRLISSDDETCVDLRPQALGVDCLGTQESTVE